MLHTLQLQNFALVDDAEVTLNAGFNVITGETGAGKSLILDALTLCMGGRGVSEMVRFGKKNAELVAHFDSDNEAVAAWFREHERDFCEGELIIRRQLTAEGRSKAWINGVPASLAELKSLGLLLVNIHSQHAGLDLLKPNFALHWLDTVAGLTDDATALKTAYQNWQTLQHEQEQAAAALSGRLDRITLLKSKLDDIAPLMGVDMAAVESQYDELSNIEQLINDAFAGAMLLDGDGDEPSAVTLLGRAIRLCEKNSHLSETFSHAASQLTEAFELIKDTAMSLADYGDNQNTDPETLEKLNSLMSQAHSLSSKYRTPITALVSEAKTWQEELDKLETLPDAASLETKIAKAYDSYASLARALTEKRKAAAVKFCTQLEEKLAPLALPNASCQFVFEPRQSAAAFGLHDVDLMFSANVGMPLLPLHKVASGGELSRMALVMQVMRAKSQEGLPLLVFDEVDVGISGGTAQVVGELLRTLGTSQQLLAITHQAQVAASGHGHILVKKEHGELTTSHFELLTGETRVHELARMSGGVNITDETLAHARSLLDATQQP